MSGASPVRLLSVPAAAADRLSGATLADATSYFDPDAVLLPGNRNARGYAAVRTELDAVPAIHPQLGRNGERASRYGPGQRGLRPAEGGEAETPTLLAIQSGAVLADLRGRPDPIAPGADATYLFVPEFSVEADRTSLCATLPFADDVAAIAASIDGPLAVLAGGQPAGYHHVWTLPIDASASGSPASVPEADPAPDSPTVDVPVVGLGAGGEGGAAFVDVVCGPDGVASADAIAADRFGLRALDGVGAATEERLADVGCRTRADVGDVAVAELATIEGIGRRTAERLHAHAEVIETGAPLKLTNESPAPTRSGQPPLCLDIETDGLSPTIIWQFGVYDPAADTYRAFLERTDPADAAGVLGRFVEWLLGTHADRALLTWNGTRFDYPQIERFLHRHYPHYVEAWTDVRRYDLYEWAVRDGNALLPGRTNRLGDVAEALGYEPRERGLSGARTAAAYRRFMRRPDDPAAEPDWARHERYCRDDCEALWHVYEAIESADRRDTTDSGSGGASGRQSGLTEF
ncbi:ribonuclease H domain protein [Natronomonas moolapensis 8.8.11]|uniref:Ribonuclease H domain protein n=1 Tax=Natronomonas moolapensis (strain DSM 18674 / CECT 7526 / JCM 14361 / 8.8.11) TaxID=268739 RepID=M1XSI0_NATM8|nr:ribonuclease H-like domain-containing protein [Natronomonas moolapensis]CCQ37332.1 ribonuclease H domain protein [Natronomonas moolapensis 8.8.11]